MARNLVRYVGEISAKKKKQHWAEEKPKRDSARRLRGICFYRPGSRRIQWNIENHSKEVGSALDSAMPCKLRKTSGIHLYRHFRIQQMNSRWTLARRDLLQWPPQEKGQNCLRIQMRCSRIHLEAHHRDSKQRSWMSHCRKEGSIRWVLLILCTNLFLCPRQWRFRMRRPQLTKSIPAWQDAKVKK